ncbi:MAG: DNA recombination protein RmuC [Deltaproteobacteria bacterium]|nr:DNA recombination protein RmuC [Deltaproteobacteria bacterium]
MALGWLLVRHRCLPRLTALQVENTALSEQNRLNANDIEEQKAIVNTLRTELTRLWDEFLDITRQNAAATGRLDRLASLESALADRDSKIESLQTLIADLKTRQAELTVNLENQRQVFDEKTALLKDLRNGLSETHKALSTDALRQNNQAFLELAQATFSKYLETAKTDFSSREKAVKDTIQPIKEALDRYDRQIQEMERSRENAYGGLARQVESLIQTQEILQKETGKLVNALRVPHVRGRWGEITLKRVAEMAGMQNHCDFFEQTSTQTDNGLLRPDMIVHLPGKRNIIIDAKVPLSAYLEAIEAETESEKEIKLNNHARQVAVHIKKLSQKAYWAQFEATPEFVVLFIPGENFFAAALAHNPQLIEWGVRDGVVLATPTTLISLLKTVAYGWQQEKMAENARKISVLGTELFERLSTMSRHINNLGRDIERSAKSYNQVVGSLERRVFSSARKFKALGVSSRDDHPPIIATPVDSNTRRIQLDDDK